MSATKSACLALRVDIANSASSVSTINVSDFAVAGCTIRGITMETQATAGGSARIAIAGGGNSLLVGATATPNPIGLQDLALTGTAANLKLASTDTIAITMSAAASTNNITIYYGEETPASVAVVTT